MDSRFRNTNYANIHKVKVGTHCESKIKTRNCVILEVEDSTNLRPIHGERKRMQRMRKKRDDDERDLDDECHANCDDGDDVPRLSEVHLERKTRELMMMTRELIPNPSH